MSRTLGLLAVFALACPPLLAQEAAPAAALAPQITVALATNGSEPRRELRYDLASVGTQVTQMDMDMTVGMGFAGQNVNQVMPTMRTTIRVVDPTVNGDGNLRLALEVAEMSVVPDATTDPTIAAHLQAALAEVGTFRGTLTMDARGNLVASDFDMSDVSPAVRQQMESTMQTMQQSVIPFPDEAVGVGARWSVAMHVAMNGMALDQVADYEVLEIGDDGVRIATTLRQSAEPQTLALPDMPPGASAELLSYAGTGSGGMTIRFDQAMPEGSFSVANDMRMRSTDPVGGSMDMTMNLSVAARMTTVE